MLNIIDGDVLAYHSCGPEAHITGDSKIIVNLNQAEMINPYGINELTEDAGQAYIEKAWKKFVRMLNDLNEITMCDHYLMAVKSEDNFRNDMYPDYKANRHANPLRRNPFVATLRQIAVDEGLAIEAVGREADDYIGIWAEEARSLDIPFVISSVDKDLNCIAGLHYKMHHKVFLEVSTQEAMLFYYEQLLKGDPTDNIPGVPRVGEVKARALLSECNTEEDCQIVVARVYAAYYGDFWREWLLSNGKMIHIQKSYNDYFTLENWAIPSDLRKIKKLPETVTKIDITSIKSAIKDLKPPPPIMKV